jgi:hypothetical protein
LFYFKTKKNTKINYKHKAQSTKHKAQSTKHKAQSNFILLAKKNNDVKV